MTKIIAVSNQKGGVAKTTTTRNVGSALAAKGKRVLFIDFDPQGHLTLSFGVNPLNLQQTVYHALIDDNVPFTSIILHHQSGIDLAPTNIDLAGAEIELLNEIGNNNILREKLAPIQAHYDYIFIDCPPSLGLLTINALSAAHGVFIPVECHYLAYYGLQLLMRTVDKVKRRSNPNLAIVGILPTKFDARTTHSKEVLGELRTNYQGMVIDIPIPLRISLADAIVAGKSIFEYDGSSEVARLYKQVAEVVDRG